VGKTLIIFEFKDEIESFIAQRSLNELRADNIIVLAIQPEAQVYMKHLNISFLNTNDLFGKEGHEQALLKTEEIYKFCETLFHIEDEIGIKKGYAVSFLLYVRHYVQYILWLITIIDRVCCQWSIKEIIACRRDNRHITSPMMAVGEGYAADIAELVAEKYRIGFNLFRGKKSAYYLFLGEIEKYLVNLAKFIIFHFAVNLTERRAKRDKTILATSKSYNLERVLKQFKDKWNNCRIIYLSNRNVSFLKKIFPFHNSDGYLPLPNFLYRKRSGIFLEKLTAATSSIENSERSDAVFKFNGIYFKKVIFQRIKSDILPYLREVYVQSIYLKRAMDRLSLDMVISQMGRDIYYNLGELASLNNIRSLLITHGSHVPPKNEFEMLGWREHSLGLMNTHYGYIAVQSPWAKEYLKKIPTNSVQIITGPLLFSKVNGNKENKQLKQKLVPKAGDKIILLHADSPRQRIDFRFYVYQTVDEYISSLNSLIGAIQHIKDLYLIIRFRPKPYLSEKELKSLLIGSDCYSIHAEGSFEEYLSVADMLISYSSTTIEEALQNKIPVLLYDRQGKYCHIPCQALDPSVKPRISSCYFVSSQDHLQWAFNWLTENHFARELSDSIWAEHLFGDEEKQDLAAYFAGKLCQQEGD